MAEQKVNEVQSVQVNIPAIYCNGFALALLNADVSMFLQTDGQPIAKLNMSFTTAKTLVTLLGDLTGYLEKATGREIMTTQEVTAGPEKIQRPGT